MVFSSLTELQGGRSANEMVEEEQKGANQMAVEEEQRLTANDGGRGTRTTALEDGGRTALRSKREISLEQTNILQKSKKKYKIGDEPFNHNETTVSRNKAWMKEGILFKEMLMHHNREWSSEDKPNLSGKYEKEPEQEKGGDKGEQP